MWQKNLAEFCHLGEKAVKFEKNQGLHHKLGESWK